MYYCIIFGGDVSNGNEDQSIKIMPLIFFRLLLLIIITLPHQAMIKNIF